MDIGSDKKTTKHLSTPSDKSVPDSENGTADALNRHLKKSSPDTPPLQDIDQSETPELSLSDRSLSPSEPLLEEDEIGPVFVTAKHRTLLPALLHDLIANHHGCIRSESQKMMEPIKIICSKSTYDESSFLHYLQHSPENARSVLFYAACLLASGLKEDYDWATELMSHVINYQPNVFVQQLNCWQAMYALSIFDKLPEYKQTETLFMAEKLATRGDPMGAWMNSMINLGLINDGQGVIPITGLRNLHEMSNQSFVNPDRIDSTLPVSHDPLSFSDLDLIPRVKNLSDLPQLKMKMQNISSTQDKDFRYLFLPWLLKKIYCVSDPLFNPDQLATELDNDNFALKLVNPFYIVHDVIKLYSESHTSYAEDLEKKIDKAYFQYSASDSTLSENARNDRLLGDLRKLNQKYVNFSISYPSHFTSEVNDCIENLDHQLKREKNPYFQGLLHCFKAILFELKAKKSKHPSMQAAEQYMLAVNASLEDFYTQLNPCAEIYLSAGHPDLAAKAKKILGKFLLSVDNPEEAKQAFADSRLYQSKAKELAELQSLPPTPDALKQTAAPTQASKDVDSQWVPDNMFRQPHPTSKKHKKGSQTHKKRGQNKTSISGTKTTSQPAPEACIKPKTTVAPTEPSQTLATASPSSSPHKKPVNTEPKDIESLLPRCWEQQIFRIKNQAIEYRRQYEYDEEGYVLEKGIEEFRGCNGVERLHEEYAWHLIRIQHHPDMMRARFGGHAQQYKAYSKLLFDQADHHLKEALSIKLSIPASQLPESDKELTVMAEQKCREFKTAKDQESYMNGFSCIMQSLGHLRYHREGVVSKQGKEAVKQQTKAAYQQKLTRRTRDSRAP